MFKIFGARPSKKDINSYTQSDQWGKGTFQNMIRTEMNMEFKNFPSIFFKQFVFNYKLRPKNPIPIFKQRFSEENIFQGKWYGHSTLFLKVNGLHILIDPMFGGNAAPVSPFPIKRFSKNTINIIKNLPVIDVILLSHDHYDHLDYKSIMRLKSKTKAFIVSLGVKRHLIKWGVPAENIFELDWWGEKTIDNVRFISTPGRHFSGRSMNDRNLSLWGGFAIQSEQEKIWYSGDSGYGPHFKMIGERLGPFDLGFIECGQYSEHWKNIHLFPEDSVKASKEAGVKKAIPIHWAGFSISQHEWKEPAQRFIKEAKNENLDYCLPQLGEVFNLKTDNKYEWWEKLK